jgi:ATP-dependent RNA helicase DeaD
MNFRVKKHAVSLEKSFGRIILEAINFEDMGLKPELLAAIQEKGYAYPTPIQAQAIMPALAGQDVMGQAQTGTGKTASFAIPVLNKIHAGGGLQALTLCPTRELAVQVAEEFNALGKKGRFFCLPIYGGQPIGYQIRNLLRRPEIIVATPGRLIDHYNRKTISLEGLTNVILDEADEMLDMGFMPDIEKILALCPEDRQTFLFSATLADDVQRIARRFLKSPLLIKIKSEELTVSLTQQFYYRVSPNQKVETLCRVIDVEQPQVCLVFCRTKKGADTLALILNRRGYPAQALHGDMSQNERDSVMDRFRAGDIRILVATDLAARGLDVDMITHVVNYDIPENPAVYVHRIGRTGRAGRDGIAITLVEPSQLRLMKLIEKHTGKRVIARVLPSLQDALQKRKEDITIRILEACEDPLETYQDTVADLLAKQPPEVVLAALIKLLMDEGPELETTELAAVDPSRAHVEISIGRRQGVNPRRLVEFITAHTRLKPFQVGDIDIQGNSCLVEVPIQAADEVSALFEHGARLWFNKTGGRDNNQKPFRGRNDRPRERQQPRFPR